MPDPVKTNVGSGTVFEVVKALRGKGEAAKTLRARVAEAQEKAGRPRHEEELSHPLQKHRRKGEDYTR